MRKKPSAVTISAAKKRRSRNTKIYCIVIFILLAIACLNGRYSTELKENAVHLSEAEFQVHVMDVGQGDSILVIADGEAMLIDSAESSSGETIAAYLEKQNITKLKYAVATHMHADHIGGFPTVLREVPAETVLEPLCPDSLVPTTRTYERFLETVEDTDAVLKTVRAGDSFSLGAARITVLAPVSEEFSDQNNISVVLRVEYDGVRCLFTGDMEMQEEQSILDSGAGIRADFLKVGHHGSDTSSGEDFLAAVQPRFAAISCGADNSYGHPAEETLQKLRQYTEDIKITAEDGDIVFLYDKDSRSSDIISSKENGPYVHD